MLSQSYLKLWKDDYFSKFLYLNNHELITKIIGFQGQLVLTGPKLCGKKHLSFYLSKTYNYSFFISELLSDSEILDIYEKCKLDNVNCVWIVNNIETFSKDVKSRFNALMMFKIKELDEFVLEEYLNARLERIGVSMEYVHLKYVFDRLVCTYYEVDRFIEYIASSNIINFKILRKFFKN